MKQHRQLEGLLTGPDQAVGPYASGADTIMPWSQLWRRDQGILLSSRSLSSQFTVPIPPILAASFPARLSGVKAIPAGQPTCAIF